MSHFRHSAALEMMQLDGPPLVLWQLAESLVQAEQFFLPLNPLARRGLIRGHPGFQPGRRIRQRLLKGDVPLLPAESANGVA